MALSWSHQYEFLGNTCSRSVNWNMKDAEYFRFHPIRHSNVSTCWYSGHFRTWKNINNRLYIKNLKKDAKEAVNALDKKITHQEKKDRQKTAEKIYGPYRNRTYNLLIKSQLLCLVELTAPLLKKHNNTSFIRFCQ